MKYSKDRVSFMVNQNKPEPYRTYYKQRNGSVASFLANILDLSSDAEMVQDHPLPSDYVVPDTTLTADVASCMGIESAADFYGLVVEAKEHVDKGILHPTFTTHCPPFYSKEFTAQVRNLVLPGCTCFSKDEALSYFDKMQGAEFSLRLKMPGCSDGMGQYSVKDRCHLIELFSNMRDPLFKSGVVLEAEVLQKQTISVGFAVLAGHHYSFLAKQKNDIPTDNSRDRFVGSDMLVVRGTMEKLLGLARGLPLDAVNLCTDFYKKYSLFDPVASRLSFDCLFGVDKKGCRLAGVTDITGRLGGNCPGLVMGIKELKKSVKMKSIEVSVDLNYSPKTRHISHSDNFVCFVDTPTLQITGQITRRVYEA